MCDTHFLIITRVVLILTLSQLKNLSTAQYRNIQQMGCNIMYYNVFTSAQFKAGEFVKYKFMWTAVQWRVWWGSRVECLVHFSLFELQDCFSFNCSNLSYTAANTMSYATIHFTFLAVFSSSFCIVEWRIVCQQSYIIWLLHHFEQFCLWQK